MATDLAPIRNDRYDPPGPPVVADPSARIEPGTESRDDDHATKVDPNLLRSRSGRARRGADLAARARLHLRRPPGRDRAGADLPGGLAEALADAPARPRLPHQDRGGPGAPARPRPPRPGEGPGRGTRRPV